MLTDEDRLVAAKTAPNQLVAEMWRSMLQDNGIPSVVQTSDAYAYLGALSPCTLLVSAYQADEAKSLLDTNEREQPANARDVPRP